MCASPSGSLRRGSTEMKRAALLLLVAPIALAACGSSHRASSSVALPPVRAAIAKTVGAPSLHFTATYRGSAAGSGDIDNTHHLVRLVSKYGTVLIFDGGKSAFISVARGRWAKTTSQGIAAQGLPPYDPTSLMGYLSLRGAVEIGPRHYRLWTKPHASPVDLWLSNGYVRRIRNAGTTERLSNFGEIQVSLPRPSEVQS